MGGVFLGIEKAPQALKLAGLNLRNIENPTFASAHIAHVLEGPCRHGASRADGKAYFRAPVRDSYEVVKSHVVGALVICHAILDSAFHRGGEVAAVNDADQAGRERVGDSTGSLCETDLPPQLPMAPITGINRGPYSNLQVPTGRVKDVLDGLVRVKWSAPSHRRDDVGVSQVGHVETNLVGSVREAPPYLGQTIVAPNARNIGRVVRYSRGADWAWQGLRPATRRLRSGGE